MSKRHDIQEATGVVMRLAPVGVMYIIASTTPTASAAGFGHGCVWVNTAGGANTTFYVNTGTNTSATWTALA